MATLEIDSDELAMRLSQAITFAIQECAKKNMKVVGILEPEAKVQPKKRGRPKKKKVENDVIIPVGDMAEPLQEILEYKPPARNEYVAPAKRANFVPRANDSTVGMSAQAQSVVDPDRKMRFFDDPVVGDRFKYAEPIPTTRAPAVKQKFTCDRCHRDFEAYWSEVPNALYKERIPGVGEGQSYVTCDSCMGR